MKFYDKTGGKRGEVTLAGRSIPVIKGPRLQRGGYSANLWQGIKSLCNGMRLTIQTFLRPSRIVTRQYPENRATLKMAERYRARLRLRYDDRGYHLCTVCRSCEKACPNASIAIEAHKGEVTGRNELSHFVWRFDSCTFCNLCVYVCPFDAIEMTGEFENAVFDRRLLVFSLNNYKGPHAALIDKIEDPAVREKVRVPISPYSGNVPLAGFWLPGTPRHLSPPEPAATPPAGETP